jgi:hypothetical protein
MLFAMSEGGAKRLTSFAQADSLIQAEFDDFNIQEQQIQITTTNIDSNLTRKTYHVRLPYTFSKTQFHAALNDRFHRYAVKTPARVTFPQQNVDIHLTFRGTVLRTISLQTDPELVAQRNQTSILMTFKKPPNQQLLDQLAQMGESIPIVLKIANPMQASTYQQKFSSTPARLIFWFQTKEGDDLIEANPALAVKKLQQLQEVLPEALILRASQNSNINERIVQNTDLTLINAGNALLLHEQLGKSSFMNKLRSISTATDTSMALVQGNKTTLNWLQEQLPELKRNGVDITFPPAVTL